MLKRVIIPVVLGVLAVLADLLFQSGALHAESEHGFEWRRSVATAIVGLLIGLVLDVALELRESLFRLEKVGHEADARLALLTELPLSELAQKEARHFEVLCRLIGDALKNVRVMANVDLVRYLSYLERALAISETYEGVQRFPIRWFQQESAPYYLEKLKIRSMARKVRLFVIDDDDAGQMELDLSDEQLLDFYWKHTGSDVRSYWIRASELRKEGLPVVGDCALYDRRLLIEYDEGRRVLGFSVGDRDPRIKDASKLFSRIRKQEEKRAPPFFHTIPQKPPPKTPTETLPPATAA
ncbi:MAG TPA: hypothetical protein VG963_10355 [Polyangiaceae bacterium]|nr:hypothetical protein [Polyangiaceae bacterium]